MTSFHQSLRISFGWDGVDRDQKHLISLFMAINDAINEIYRSSL